MESYAATENTKPRHTWERSYLLKFAMGPPIEWVSYFALLSEGELLGLFWDHTVLLQDGPV